MTEKYASLTVESVKYWYWECDPAYSVIDIVKVREQINRHSIDSWNASRIQSYTDKSGKSKGFKSGAQRAASNNKK